LAPKRALERPSHRSLVGTKQASSRALRHGLVIDEQGEHIVVRSALEVAHPVAAPYVVHTGSVGIVMQYTLRQSLNDVAGQAVSALSQTFFLARQSSPSWY